MFHEYRENIFLLIRRYNIFFSKELNWKMIVPMVLRNMSLF